MADIGRLFRRLMARHRLAVQVMDGDFKGQKAELVKRFTILIKNFSGTFPKFQQPIPTPVETASEAPNDPQKPLKAFCVIPGIHNIVYEAFDISQATPAELTALMVAGALKSPSSFLGTA